MKVFLELHTLPCIYEEEKVDYTSHMEKKYKDLGTKKILNKCSKLQSQANFLDKYLQQPIF